MRKCTYISCCSSASGESTKVGGVLIGRSRPLRQDSGLAESGFFAYILTTHISYFTSRSLILLTLFHYHQTCRLTWWCLGELRTRHLTIS